MCLTLVSSARQAGETDETAHAPSPASAFTPALSIVLAPGAAAQDSTGAPSPISIAKVSFLIHPVCWDLALAEGGRLRPNFRYQSFTYRGGAWYDEQEFYEILEWGAAGQPEAEGIHPGHGAGRGAGHLPHRKPAGHAGPGERGAGAAGAPLPDHPLGEPSANRKVDYRQLLPDAVKIELLNDLLEAVRHNSDTWNAQALEVIFYNRMIALEIEREFRQRRLQVDPKKVEALAFGEGFEQCATTLEGHGGQLPRLVPAH